MPQLWHGGHLLALQTLQELRSGGLPVEELLTRHVTTIQVTFSSSWQKIMRQATETWLGPA
jgi:hypothetical protein